MRLEFGTRPRQRAFLAVGLTLIALAALPRVASACAVCYGSADSAMTEGMNNGILSLLAVILVVQVGFAALFLGFRRRARQLRQRKDRFQVIQGGAG